MKNKNPLPHFIKILNEVSAYYAMHHSEYKWIWKLSEKGFLFKIFKEFEKSGNHEKLFYKKVDDVINTRRNSISKSNVLKIVSGKFLLFDPLVTMYDGLSEEITNGFFDSDDIPPPEFWVGVYNEKLISFIPHEFIDIANSGVEHCISGCLEWMGEEFFINSDIQYQGNNLVK